MSLQNVSWTPQASSSIAEFINANRDREITVEGYTKSDGVVAPTFTIVTKDGGAYRGLLLKAIQDVESMKGISPMHAKVATELQQKWGETLDTPPKEVSGTDLVKTGACYLSSSKPGVVTLCSVEVVSGDNPTTIAVKKAPTDEDNVRAELTKKSALGRYLPRLNLAVGKVSRLCVHV
jgi:hypothetical protein